MQPKVLVAPVEGRFNVTFVGLSAEQALRLTTPMVAAPAGPPALPKVRKPAKPRVAKPKDEVVKENPDRPAPEAKAFIDLLTEAGDKGVSFDDLKAKFQVSDLRKLRAHIVGARKILGNRLLKSDTGYVLKS